MKQWPITQWLICVTAVAWIRLSYATARLHIVDPHNSLPHLQNKKGGAVMAFWHGQLLLSGYVAHKVRRSPTALISRHRDGRTLTRAARMGGWTIVEGSPKRGGMVGLKAMVAAGRRGDLLFFAPDGPRGPLHTARAGAVQAARMAGVPLVGAGLAMRGGWRAKTWDRLAIPRPFAKVYVVLTKPLTPTTDDDIEPHRQALEAALQEAQHQAEALCS